MGVSVGKEDLMDREGDGEDDRGRSKEESRYGHSGRSHLREN
jgi:hypothetical protein